MRFYVGVDLGQTADYTAVAVIESGQKENPAGGAEPYLHLRHLERYELRTLYPDIADGIAALVQDPLLSPLEYNPSTLHHYRRAPELIVDQTGVGPAVTDLLKKKGLRFRAVTITGGNETNYGGGSWHVPKRDIVGALEVPFHTGELKIAEDLPLAPVLKKELLDFKRKINLKTGHDSYEHWREGDHDDLVLAAALACWWARRRGGTRRVRFYSKPLGF
jgi:hypothetical protein